MRHLRVSVGGLMGIVLVVSLGLAALRSGSPIWAGATFLAACGVLALAAVGAACRSGKERAWWLGFSVCGWGYLALAIGNRFPSSTLPTTALLRDLGPLIGFPESPFLSPFYYRANKPYFQTGHSLFGIIAATIGGLITLGLFPAPRASARDSTSVPGPEDRSSRRPWRRTAALRLAGLVAVSGCVAIGMARAPGTWAAGAFFATWGMLCLAVVGAASNRGRARAAWLGAALFGIGYMGLIFRRPGIPNWPHVATDRLLHSIRGRFPWIVWVPSAPRGDVNGRNARILKALDLPVEMSFPSDTPLEDVLKYVMSKMNEANVDFIPIYVDPVALEAVEKTLQSSVTIDVEGLPLRISLRLVLAQLGLAYKVEDGLLKVTILDENDWGRPPPAYEDPFLVVGHCVLGLCAAGLGGLLAPLVCPRQVGRIASSRG